MVFHKHHKLPKHAGGGNDPENLIKVSIEEHANLHLARYLDQGDKEDWIAAFALSGQISCEEAISQARRNFLDKNPHHLSEAGKKGGKAPASERAKQVAKETARATGKKPWWNNGLNNRRSYTCPGEGYVSGKLPHGKHKRTYTQCPHCELICVVSNLSRHIKSKHV